MSKYLLPRQWSDLRETILLVFRIHCLDLFAGRCSQDFDDLDELVHSTFPWEDWLSKHEFSDDAAYRPHINSGSVIRVSKNQLWCSVIPRANIRYIWLTLHELLSTSEITELKDVRLGIAKDVLGLDISMANTFGVNVGNGPHELIGIELNNERWDHLLHFEVLLHYSVGRVRDVVHDHIQVNFVWLVSIRVEALTHLHTVGMVQHLQNRQLSIFISLVLENFFNCNCLAGFRNRGLEHHSERPITNNFFGVIGHALN